MSIKITGLKRAVGEYKRANAGGRYSPRYGRLMLDRDTGELWVDEFYSLGHNAWKVYRDKAIVDIISYIRIYNVVDYWEDIVVNMVNVRAWATKACEDYATSKEDED